MMEFLEKVTILLVNYNGKKYLEKCIESLYRQTYLNMSILIVDNCSDDGSVKFLKDRYPNIETIVCPQNYGFAKGNNIGIRYALDCGTDYVMLLNIDTTVDAHLLEYLMQEADQDTVTVPTIYYDKRYMKIWYAGGEMDYVKGDSSHILKGGNRVVQEVSFACGCCVLIHKKIIEKTGLFDENFYLYYEDTDWSLRCIKEGIKIKYVPRAKMWHKIGGSGGKKGELLKTYYMTRNQLYFVKKHQDFIQMNTLKRTVQIMKDSFSENTEKEKRKYIWHGIRDFYRGKMGRLNLEDQGKAIMMENGKANGSGI